VSTTWDLVDERVLRWVASLPTAFSNDEIYDFPVQPPEAFAPLRGLNTQEVGEALRRLHDAGFIGGKSEYEAWYELHVAPNGLIYLGEWPDLSLAASALALHRLLRDIAAQAPEQERNTLTRAAGVLGRTGDAVLRDALSEVIHAGGEDLAT
jgi:hypothetical protein